MSRLFGKLNEKRSCFGADFKLLMEFLTITKEKKNETSLERSLFALLKFTDMLISSEQQQPLFCEEFLLLLQPSSRVIWSRIWREKDQSCLSIIRNWGDQWSSWIQLETRTWNLEFSEPKFCRHPASINLTWFAAWILRQPIRSLPFFVCKFSLKLPR